MATNRILDGYAGLKREINLIFGQELKKFSYGPKQMMLLYHLGRQGPLDMGALAECTQSDKATITRAISALEKHDLIKRQADATDSRRVIIQLTAKGRIHSNKALKVREYLGRRIDKTLTLAEREAVARLLHKIVTGLQGGR